MNDLNPLTRDFILFCAGRCDGQWPALYDEMCWVAGHHMFHDMGYAELGMVGLSLGCTTSITPSGWLRSPAADTPVRLMPAPAK